MGPETAMAMGGVESRNGQEIERLRHQVEVMLAYALDKGLTPAPHAWMFDAVRQLPPAELTPDGWVPTATDADRRAMTDALVRAHRDLSRLVSPARPATLELLQAYRETRRPGRPTRIPRQQPRAGAPGTPSGPVPRPRVQLRRPRFPGVGSTVPIVRGLMLATLAFLVLFVLFTASPDARSAITGPVRLTSLAAASTGPATGGVQVSSLGDFDSAGSASDEVQVSSLGGGAVHAPPIQAQRPVAQVAPTTQPPAGTTQPTSSPTQTAASSATGTPSTSASPTAAPSSSSSASNHSSDEQSFGRLLLRELFLLVAAGLGASFTALYRASREVARGTYDPEFDHTFLQRIALGMATGLIIAEMLPLGDTVYATLARPALALLGGFGAGVVHKVLSRVVSAVETLFSGDPDELEDSRRELAQKRADEVLVQAERATLARLLEIRRIAASGAPARAVIDEIDHMITQVSPA